MQFLLTKLLLQKTFLIFYKRSRVYAIRSKPERSSRQTRHSEFIAQLTTDIRFIKRKDNVVYHVRLQ